MSNFYKKEAEALLKKAENEFSSGDYIKAMMTFSSVLVLNDTNYKAYFGMYKAWSEYCFKIKDDSPMIEDLFNNAYRYAPKNIKKVYLEEYKRNCKRLIEAINENK